MNKEKVGRNRLSWAEMGFPETISYQHKLVSQNLTFVAVSVG